MIITPSPQRRTHTVLGLLAICLGYSMIALDLTIVNVAFVTIKEPLHVGRIAHCASDDVWMCTDPSAISLIFATLKTILSSSSKRHISRPIRYREAIPLSMLRTMG